LALYLLQNRPEIASPSDTQYHNQKKRDKILCQPTQASYDRRRKNIFFIASLFRICISSSLCHFLILELSEWKLKIKGRSKGHSIGPYFQIDFATTWLCFPGRSWKHPSTFCWDSTLASFSFISSFILFNCWKIALLGWGISAMHHS